MTTTEVTVKENETIAKYSADLMDDAPVVATDILIPKLLLMQPVSQFVADEKAKAGDIVSSLGGEVIAAKGTEGVEIIPFKVQKTWIKFRQDKGRPVFVGQEPATIENAATPRHETIEGEEYTNYETLNYYVLLPHEIEAGEFLPYVLSFRSTSYKVGKVLESYRAKLQDFGKPLCFKTFTLGSRQEENDKGRYFTYTIEPSRDTAEAELDEVKPWMQRVKTQAVKVDESDLQSDSTNSKAQSSREF